jgi:UDP-glucuronate 4-epimerase
MRKILLTGAAGFIGSNLGDHLILNHYKVIGIDNFDSFYSRDIKIKNIESLTKSQDFIFYETDIREKSSLQNIFSTEKPDVIIHLAAKAGVRPSIENPKEYFDVNITGTMNILECMKDNDISDMIFASSSSVYGNNKKIPFNETDNVDNPISPYAASKKACELMCHVYCYLYGFNINCLRFFTVYGPRQRPDLAIHKFTRALLSDEFITLYGDGTSGRDYTNISDIIQGIVNSMQSLKGYEITNIGGSNPVTLIELIRLLERVTGKPAKLKYLPFQAGDVDLTYADIAKAKSNFGYNPGVPLEEGLKEFVSWFRKFS